MLTGKRAFAGDDISDTLASVLRDEADWSALPADTPPGVVQALRVCLRKDPKQRVRDISAVRLSMGGAFDSTAIRPAPSKRRWLTAAAMGVLGAASAAAMTWMLTRSTPAPAAPARFLVPPPDGQCSSPSCASSAASRTTRLPCWIWPPESTDR
ncbi:MAG: hypothetical protein K2Y23_02765 [Cyanobacteria bacterium]|nr:hypothetical protein [Cyanobacteriota bacterium]